VRTNIDIDDDLMAKAMAATDATTKKGAVEQGLQLLVRLKAQEGIKKLRGKVAWRGHDDGWLAPDAEILEKRRAEQDRGSASSRPLADKRRSSVPMEPR
jgi:Arc/MetJ family transcription regulator